MVGQNLLIYPTEHQLNKSNSSDTEAPFWDLNLSILIGIVSSKICDKRDNLNIERVNVSFLDGGVYISQLIRFVKMYSNVDYFNK